MNLFKFIWRYWTSSTFRNNIGIILYRLENQEELTNQFNEELKKIREETLETCKKRIDNLVYIKDHVPGGMALSKINELINELKEDYRDIENEKFT